jgi:hypothetical protein
MHLANAVSGALHMATSTRGERHDTILEDENVQCRRDRNAWALLFDLTCDQGLEGDEVVVLEDVDFLPRLSDGDILRCQGVDGQGLSDGVDV